MAFNLATASIKGKGHIFSRPLSDHLDRVDAKAFGAIGNGLPNLLSSLYGSLAAAQVFYPKATALTDSADWAAIQGAVDYALTNKIMNVILPDGIFMTSDTIHLGYGFIAGGPNFNCVVLQGVGWAAIAGMQPGTQITPMFKDRPVINIQGGRESGVRNLSIIGQGTAYETHAQTLADRRVAANYVGAGMKNDQFQPYCGVCIDGYAGNATTPASPYPVPRYAAFCGTPSHTWDAGLSSRWFVENCHIYNTHIGVMCQPYRDGNGDFGRCTNSAISHQKIAVAVGNSQARNMDFQNMTIDCVHTCFDSTTHGHGVGNLQGNFSNLALNGNYRILHGNGGWSQPLHITSMYQEVGMIIGDFVGGVVTFDSCSFSMHDTRVELSYKSIAAMTWSAGVVTVTMASGHELSTWGVTGWAAGVQHAVSIVGANPAGYQTNGWALGTRLSNTQFTYPLASNPGTYTSGGLVEITPIAEWSQEPMFVGSATFRRCNFFDRYVYHFQGGGLYSTFENMTFQGPTGPNTPPLPAAMKNALDAFGHVLVNLDSNTLGSPPIFSGVNSYIARQTDAPPAPISSDGYNKYQGRSLWNYGQKGYGYNYVYDIMLARYNIANGAMGPLSGVTRVYTTGDERTGVAPGDIYHIGGEGAHMYVESVGAGPAFPATCKCLTWFKMVGGVFSMLTKADIDWGKNPGNPALDYDPSANINVPIYYPIGTLDLSPSTYTSAYDFDGVFMKTEKGSPTITFISFAGDVETPITRPAEIVATSKPLWVGVKTRWSANSLPFPAFTIIANVNPTPNTITMSNNALRSGVWSYGPGIRYLFGHEVEVVSTIASREAFTGDVMVNL